ncbi:MAG: rhodanese-like domain-containing protein [Acidobacteriota bacterium]
MSKARLTVAFLAALSLFWLIHPGTEQRSSSDGWSAVKQWVRSEFPEVEQVSVERLSSWLDSDEPPPLLLDVREDAEFRVSHLPGAIRIDPDVRKPKLPEGIDMETPIVAYCSVGYRSSALVERLRRQGYTRVMNLEGSIFEWANEGYEVVRDEVEVLEVHPYDETWGRWLAPELHAYPADAYASD